MNSYLIHYKIKTNKKSLNREGTYFFHKFSVPFVMFPSSFEVWFLPTVFGRYCF
jgi:hypothetical protein